jgi:predicted dehydrogenase
MERRIRADEIGTIHLARARYGSTGPDWGPWYYRRGAGVLFDLAVYPITSLTGLIGPARRVAALSGIAVSERVVDGSPMQVEVVDNSQILLDFGGETFASVTGGFTVHTYRSPAIELYGSEGVIQMLGDDWEPHGYELWRASTGRWKSFPPPDPEWSWTDGLRHLVDTVRTGGVPVMSGEHAYHVLEIMLMAEEAARTGVTQTIASDLSTPSPDRSRPSATATVGSEQRGS